MQIIPLVATPSQTLTINLANQPCTIDVITKSTGLFLNLYVNDALIIGGVICENANRIVRTAYLGFLGDLVFFDTHQPPTDPDYTGLGSRFLLCYLSQAELAALGLSG